ncbi:MAG: DNA/RNA nuclease SfsA [Myxococcales bacterium]|nr:DNA/RNA nuclease SfsA [Myxococcales bacterium]
MDHPQTPTIQTPVTEPFPQPMVQGQLVRRYKRFLADVIVPMPDGSSAEFTAHCGNTGSMRGLTTEGSPVLLWDSKNPKRKLPWSWKAVQVDSGAWVGIDTQLPNALVTRALATGQVPGFPLPMTIKREQRMGERSRVDAVAEGEFGKAWIEVKNVTLVDEAGVASFPDAVTARGLKHLSELTDRVAEGDRAAMVYVVQRDDAHSFVPADHIDPAYGAGLRRAVRAGVEVVVMGCTVDADGVTWQRCLPWHL